MPVDTSARRDYAVSMNSTSYDLVVEAWQTDTPEHPGTWRCTATTKGRWRPDEGWITVPADLVPDPGCRNLRLEMNRFPKSNPNSYSKYVFPIVCESVETPYWDSIKITNMHVLDAVPLVSVPSKEPVLMNRVKLPPRRVHVNTTEPVGPPMQRFDETISRVRALDTDAEIRATVLEVLESFRSRVMPSFVELEAIGKARGLAVGTAVDSDFTVPLPFLSGVDASGKITLTFKGGTTTADITFGPNRSVEVAARGIFTLPDRETAERGMSDPAALAGLTGMMFGHSKVGEA